MWKCHSLRVGPRVDQFLRIDTGRRRAGDVADIVGAGAARRQPEVLDALDHRDGVLRLDLADLQVGAGGDVRVAAAAALAPGRRRRRTANGVRMPLWHAQPAHIGVLIRRDVEQAEIAPAEIVGRLGKLVGGGLRLQPAVGVERVLLALELLLVGQLLPGPQNFVLSAGSIRFGTFCDSEERPKKPSDPAEGEVRAALAICRPATNPSR